ncbi:MAG: exo-alpha-sialidase [Spirochaetes bacterium]|nr:exo-alpha-sialidase [Spirochaetota bacterium]
MKRLLSGITTLYFRFALVRQLPWALVVLVIFALAAALVFQNRKVTTNPAGWERSFQVSSFNVVARDISVSSRGDVIAAAYEGREGWAQGIYVSLSFDGGVTFIPSIRVAAVASKTAMNPHAAVSPSGVVTVMWNAYLDAESTTRIFYSTSKDLGATWSRPKKIALEKELQMEMLPRVYYDDLSVLHLFYHGSVSDNISLFHARSEDGEQFKTTGPLIRLGAGVRGAFFPSIIMSGKYFFMVWQAKQEDYSDELYFMKSSNFGRTWSLKKRITDSPGNNAAPSMILHDDTLYVVYHNNDEKNWTIKMVRGFDRGWSWDEEPLTVSGTMANCYSPSIGVSGGDIMVLWYDTREGGARIFARKYSTREKTFLPETEVSEARYQSKNPSVVSLGRRLLVFWEERNVIMAKQTDVYVKPPAVFSETNPEGQWSRLPYIVMQWRPSRDESGIVGYAALRNEIPDFNPTVVNMKPGITMEKITDNIGDGISYYHIRAVDGAGNFSRTIHYKLQLAINPLPGPVIVSPTNPQGKPSEVRAPVFTWAIDEPERIKGFVYTISKDAIRMPDTFTTDMNMRFKDLEDGNYFFSVAAVDKTNQFSRVSTYDFIIGAPDRVVDPDYYKRIAEEEKKFQKYYRERVQREREALAFAPAVYIQFPFDPRKDYDRGSFKAIIVTKNIRPESVIGYSVYINKDKQVMLDDITQKGTIVTAESLSNGRYYVGVKCKYSSYVDGSVRYYWTKPFVARVSIVLPAERSPVINYAMRIMEKFPRRLGFITLTFLGLGLVITTMGFGSRISFYSRLALFRFRLMYRLMAKKE